MLKKKVVYTLNSSTTRAPSEFISLVDFFLTIENTFLEDSRVSEDYYCLPLLLEVLHSKNEIIYNLFKQFYGLTDSSIQDHEYSKQFLIYFSSTVESEHRSIYIFTYTFFTISTLSEYIKDDYEHFKKSIIDMKVGKIITDFEEFIAIHENAKRLYKMKVPSKSARKIK
jgi:hypothetical protein